MLATSPLKPPYPFALANESVELFSGSAVLRHADATLDGLVRVMLSWLPTPNVSFEFRSQHDVLVDLSECSYLELSDPDVTASIVLTAADSRGEIRGHFRDRISIGAPTDLSSIMFMLANSPRMVGGEPITDGKSYWRGRVILESRPWRVMLEPRRDYKTAVEPARTSSGFVLTHVCQLTRIDGRNFSAADADDVLRALQYFLAFARGLWTPPLLLSGVRGDQIVWREWGARTSSAWRANTTWFSDHHPEALAAVFPTFMQRWSDPRWKNTLESSISWLTEAMQQRFIDIAIVLAQVALELLGWTVLVEERGRLSRSVYANQSAAENLRQLLGWAGIPTSVPSELHELDALASASAWTDGPQALAGFRNMLVHPRDRTRTIFDIPIDAKIDLQHLAFWYVELILLRFVGYRGEYVNRNRARWVGEVEPLPWG